MSREWEPGDVMTFGSGDIRAFRTDEGWTWIDGSTSPYGVAYTDMRPLVVIDPEDREQVERFWRMAENTPADFAADLREFANPTPPKPDEPTGLGAVIEDADGVKWVLIAETSNHSSCWRRTGINEWRDYADIDAVRVLSEGVTVR